jgi:NADP-dependent 3-hydroxy acid dehydrogenase YdfG
LGNELTGRVALVTGASAGIGEATAYTLASAGATVVAAARRRDRLEAIVKKIAAGGGTADAIQLDVSDAAGVETAVASIGRRYGRLDIVVNSAGVMYSSRLEAAKPADLQAMMEINVLGTMYVSRSALGLMRPKRSGDIVNISSISSRLANPGSPGYAATKSAINTFSEALRKDGRDDNIRVIVISPGLTRTEIFEHIEDQATKERFSKMVEQTHVLEASDVAEAILYAVSRPPYVSVNEIVIRPTDEPV